MRKICIILVSLVCCALLSFAYCSAAAQDKPQPKPADKPGKAEEVKEPPAEAVIDAKGAEAIRRADDAATIAAQKTEILNLRIANAQVELKKLIDEAQRARDDADAEWARAVIKAGVPGDKVGEYTREPQKDGSIKLTRKQPPPK